MTPARFVTLLRVRGPALELWPEHDRVAARHLIAVSRRCRSGYLAALEGDQTLDDSIDPATFARLQDGTRRRLAQDGRHPQGARPRLARDAGKRLAGLPLTASLRFGTLAACGLLGVWLGWRDMAQPSPDLPAPFLLAAVQATALDPGTPDSAP
jgi:hypothetical protein